MTIQSSLARSTIFALGAAALWACGGQTTEQSLTGEGQLTKQTYSYLCPNCDLETSYCVGYRYYGPKNVENPAPECWDKTTVHALIVDLKGEILDSNGDPIGQDEQKLKQHLVDLPIGKYGEAMQLRERLSAATLRPQGDGQAYDSQNPAEEFDGTIFAQCIPPVGDCAGWRFFRTAKLQLRPCEPIEDAPEIHQGRDAAWWFATLFNNPDVLACAEGPAGTPQRAEDEVPDETGRKDPASTVEPSQIYELCVTNVRINAGLIGAGEDSTLNHATYNRIKVIFGDNLHDPGTAWRTGSRENVGGTASDDYSFFKLFSLDGTAACNYVPAKDLVPLRIRGNSTHGETDVYDGPCQAVLNPPEDLDLKEDVLHCGPVTIKLTSKPIKQ